MRSKSVALLMTAGLVVSISACADEVKVPHSEQWVSTSRGDVYCMVDDTAYNKQSLVCDWSTLVEAKTHTTETSFVAESAWRETERGDVYCLVSRLTYDFATHDCDWSTLGERVDEEASPQ